MGFIARDSDRKIMIAAIGAYQIDGRDEQRCEPVKKSQIAGGGKRCGDIWVGGASHYVEGNGERQYPKSKQQELGQV